MCERVEIEPCALPPSRTLGEVSEGSLRLAQGAEAYEMTISQRTGLGAFGDQWIGAMRAGMKSGCDLWMVPGI